MRFLSFASRSIGILIALLATLWAFGALSYDGFGVWFGVVAVIFMLMAMIRLKFRWKAWAIWGVWFAAILFWWLTLKPSNSGEWQADVAKTAFAEIDGDVITINNIRDFEYRGATDFTPRWETRKVRLSSITGVDMAVNYWGSPWMAHPIVSFRFSDAPPLAFSIETRKRSGQSYSALGGLYRQFDLIYIAAEERDVLGVRAVHRKGEDVYLYRTTLSAEQARGRFLEYITSINSLAEKPRWYNAITTNCTTAIRSQHNKAKRMPMDWRILVNGKGDEMMYERGIIVTDGLTFPEVKQRAHANTAIVAAYGKPDFSARIRSSLLFPPDGNPKAKP